MNLPYMTAATGKNRKQIIAFAGLNYGQGAGDGELAESWGLSSARFPCLSQRDGRKTAGTYTSPTGLYARGKLCVVDGTDFLYDGKVVGHVTAGEKQFATINTKIVIFPDKVYYDTEAEKFGMLAAEYPGFPGDVTFTANTLTVPEQSYIDQAAENAETKGSVAADTSITAYTGASVNKTTGALTMSGGTAGTPDKLKAGDYIQYDCDSSKEYMVVQSSAKQSDGTYQITYLLHTAALHKYPGFDELFKAGDAIEISGCTTCAANNGSHIIRSLEARKLTFTKDIFTKTGVEAGTVMLERKVPDLTCICECDTGRTPTSGPTTTAAWPTTWRAAPSSGEWTTRPATRCSRRPMIWLTRAPWRTIPTDSTRSAPSGWPRPTTQRPRASNPGSTSCSTPPTTRWKGPRTQTVRP